MNVYEYRVYVEPLSAALGGGYVSYAPDLKGCLSDGATPEEALRNIYDAISCWIEAAGEQGTLVPQPEIARHYG